MAVCGTGKAQNPHMVAEGTVGITGLPVVQDPCLEVQQDVSMISSTEASPIQATENQDRNWKPSSQSLNPTEALSKPLLHCPPALQIACALPSVLPDLTVATRLDAWQGQVKDLLAQAARNLTEFQKTVPSTT